MASMTWPVCITLYAEQTKYQLQAASSAKQSEALSCLAAAATSATFWFSQNNKRPTNSVEHNTEASPSWTCDLGSLTLFLSAW